MQVKHAISKDDATFKKAFKQLWGCSGGWVSGTCPHGVIYALKFVLRAESPRDYVDLILSMEHQPNIIISDMANMVVAHGNKRERNMFSPFNGMVAEPTKSNVQEALAGTLEVSLPWLDGEAKDCKASHKKKSGRHPVSGSEHHLCLFDRLHEKKNNSSDDLGSRSKPLIEVSKLKERPLAAEDKPWIAALGLKGRDKQLIEGGPWLNDRIINAAMQLVRNVTYENGIGGLQDVVVGNACRFSDSGGLQPGFVQEINVRGNHWITERFPICYARLIRHASMTVT